MCMWWRGELPYEMPQVSEVRTLRVGPRSEGSYNGYASVVHAGIADKIGGR